MSWNKEDLVRKHWQAQGMVELLTDFRQFPETALYVFTGTERAAMPAQPDLRTLMGIQKESLLQAAPGELTGQCSCPLLLCSQPWTHLSDSAAILQSQPGLGQRTGRTWMSSLLSSERAACPVSFAFLCSQMGQLTGLCWCCTKQLRQTSARCASTTLCQPPQTQPSTRPSLFWRQWLSAWSHCSWRRQCCQAALAVVSRQMAPAVVGFR